MEGQSESNQAQRSPTSLLKLCSEIRAVLRSDRDFLVCVSGKTGQGKSMLGQQIARKVDPKFNIGKQTVFTREEFVDLIKDIERVPMYSAIVADEAINMLFKRDFMMKGQKMLLRLLDMCRDRRLALILCIPNIWALDKHILDSRLRAWIYIEERGLGYVFVPDANPFAEDPWHRKKNEKKLKNWGLGAVPTRSPNYLGEVKFPDLDPVRKEEYLAVKAKKKEHSELYGEKVALKAAEEKKIALDVVAQLYGAGKLKKEDIREMSPSLGKSFSGTMLKINRCLKESDTPPTE